MRIDIEVCGESNICINDCPEVLKFSGNRIIVKMDKLIQRLEERINAEGGDSKGMDAARHHKKIMIMGD